MLEIAQFRRLLTGIRSWVQLPVAVWLIANVCLCLLILAFKTFAMIHITYTFNTLVVPPLFLAAGAASFATWRRHGGSGRLPPGIAAYVLLAVGLLCLRAYATHIEPYQLRVREVSFTSAKTDRRLRILHISDIQSDRIGSYEEVVFARMRELKPDMVIFTGDLLQPPSLATAKSELARMAALFAGISAPLGIWRVSGDTDAWLANLPDGCLASVRLLEDANVCLTNGNVRVSLHGLSLLSSHDPKAAAGQVRVWLGQSEPGVISILAGHRPDFAVSFRDAPVDLFLAGHTHGGQIRLPLLGPIITLTRDIPRSWARGFRKIGAAYLNVSAGIGCEHTDGLPCIRLNCPPEMTLITILPQSASSNASP